MRYVLTFLLVIIMSSTAVAEMSIEKYDISKKEEAAILDSYIAGLAMAFKLANITNENLGNSKFYCPPSNLAFNAENFTSIIDDEIRLSKSNKSSYQNTPVSHFLLQGLSRSFPCKAELDNKSKKKGSEK
jgi:hypothetical protein